MQTDRVEYPINSGYIQVVAEERTLPAFWAHPDTGGTFPGVVVIHEHWGLTTHVRRLVRHLAEVGHYVVAPDLFDGHRPETLDAARQREAGLAETGPSYVAAAITALRTHHHCNGDIALVGYGMGGRLALHLAVHRDDLKAAVIFQADASPYLALLPATATPILGFYDRTGEAMAEDDLATLDAQLKAASPSNALVLYDGVGRYFCDETRPEYAPEVAADAWARVLDFLSQRLTGPSQPPDIRHRTY